MLKIIETWYKNYISMEDTGKAHTNGWNVIIRAEGKTKLNAVFYTINWDTITFSSNLVFDNPVLGSNTIVVAIGKAKQAVVIEISDINTTTRQMWIQNKLIILQLFPWLMEWRKAWLILSWKQMVRLWWSKWSSLILKLRMLLLQWSSTIIPEPCKSLKATKHTIPNMIARFRLGGPASIINWRIFVTYNIKNVIPEMHRAPNTVCLGRCWLPHT